MKKNNKIDKENQKVVKKIVIAIIIYAIFMTILIVKLLPKQEEEYTKKRPEFLHFVECYASGKKDDVLEELILKLYQFSTSDPFPEEWLENLTLDQGAYEDENLLIHVRRLLESLLQENEQAIALCQSMGGPVFYEEALQQDKLFLRECFACQTYEEYSKAIRGRSYQALSRKKMPPEVMEEKKEAVKKVSSVIFSKIAIWAAVWPLTVSFSKELCLCPEAYLCTTSG